MADEINRVGLGVGLDGGQDVLTELRAIRQEMIAIVEAARAVPAQAASRARQTYGRTREEARADNDRQLDLFRRTNADQGRLFEQGEIDKTRVTQRESGKRKAAMTEEARHEAAVRRDAAKATRDNAVLRAEKAADAWVERRRQDEARRNQPGPSSTNWNRPTLLQDVDVEREKAQFEKSVAEVEAFKGKVISGHIRRQQRKAIIEDWEFQQKSTATVGGVNRASESEIDSAAAAKLRKLELNRRINERAEAMEREHAAKMAEIQRQERAHAAQQAEIQQRERAAAERAADRRYNPAAAPPTALEEKFRAQDREAEAKRAQESHQRQAQERRERDQRNAEEAGHRLEDERRARERERREREEDPAYQAREAKRRAEEAARSHEAFAARPRADLDKDRDTLLRLQRETSRVGGQMGGAFRAQATELGVSISNLQQRAATLRAELQAPASMKRTHDQVRSELKDIQAETQRTIERVRRLKETMASSLVGGPGGGGPPGGPPNVPRNALNVPAGALNERGFFTSVDMIGRISRNILLYQVVAGAVYGLKDYIATSIDAAKQASMTALDLENAARRSQQSVQGFYEYAEGLRTAVGVSRRSAQQVMAEAAYFAENDPSKARPLARAITDLAASRGIGGAQLPDIVEQFRRRESKFYKRYIGKTVEELYLEEAQGIVSRGEDLYQPGTGASPRERRMNNLTERERISRVVSGFSEEQKEMIAVNALLREGENVAGAAERRMQTLAGQLDRTSERWNDMKVAVGNFIAGLRPLQGLIQGIADALEGVDFSRLKGTGEGGLITEGDLSRYAEGQRTSTLGRANSLLEDYGSEAAVVGGGLLISALAGRRRARENRRRSRYTEVFDRSIAEGLDDAAATAVATEEARKLRAGLFRSIRVGMGRIGGGIVSVVSRMLGLAAADAATEGAALARAAYIRRSVAMSGAGYGAAEAALLAGAPAAGAGAARAGIFSRLGAGASAIGGAATAYGGAGGISAVGLAGAGLAVAGVLAAAAALVTLGTAAHSLATKGDLSEVSDLFSTIADWMGHIGGKGFDALKDEEAKAALQPSIVKQMQEEFASGRRYFIDAAGQRRTAAEVGTGAYGAVGELKQGRVSDDEWAKTQAARTKADQDAAQARERQEIQDKLARDEEDRKRQERVNEQSRALAKLRETAAGSFRLIEEVGGAIALDNPFVKVFADGETAAVRMRQQWGFLGDEAVKFFTLLERRKIALQGLKLEFDSLVKVQDIYNRQAQEQQEFRGPGVSRRDEAALGIYTAETEARRRLRELDRRESDIRGGYRDDERDFRAQFEDINAGWLAAYNNLSSRVGGEARSDAFRRLQDMASRDVLDLTQNMTAAQINSQPWLRDQVFRAINVQRQEAQAKRQDAYQTLQFQIENDARLKQNLQQARERRDEMLARGEDATQVGRVYDEMFLRRTDDIGVKNLSYEQYVERQAAMQRSAEREAQQAEEARYATRLSLLFQEHILRELAQLRQGILSGDLSVLIQVLNETQARVDQQDLQEADGAGFNVPLNAASDRRMNAYADDFSRYGRGGNRR